MDLPGNLAAIILMILSAIGIVVCLGGIIGVWVVRKPATQGIVGALETAAQYLGLADQTSGLAADRVTDLEARLNAIETSAANLTDADKAALNARVQQLAQPIARLGSITGALQSGLLALNETLTSLSRMPLVDVPPPPGNLNAVAESVDRVTVGLKALQSAIADAEVDSARVHAIAASTSGDLAAVASQLEQWQSGLANTRMAIASAQTQAPRLLKWTSVGVSLLLALFLAGQISLLVHAWGWLTG